MRDWMRENEDEAHSQVSVSEWKILECLPMRYANVFPLADQDGERERDTSSS